MDVSDLPTSMRVGYDYELVVDCCGKGPDRRNGVTAVPTAGDHRWNPDDLDRIVRLVTPRLESGAFVLVHCRSGRSRSTTAAAAVLLATGWTDDPVKAVAACQLPGSKPDTRCVKSLRLWWQGRVQPTLFAVP